jgi:dihydrofolate reductase
MNVILYASLSANGQVIFAEDVKHQVIPEVVADFMQLAATTRNIILGRCTYDLMLNNPMARQAFLGTELIAVSKQMQPDEGVTVMPSPLEVVQYGKSKGYEKMLVIGGVQVYQSFLTAGLINEMLLNLMPMVTAKGGGLIQKGVADLQLALQSSKEIARNIMQLHYQVQ